MSLNPLHKLPNASAQSGLPVFAGSTAPTMLKTNLSASAPPGVSDDSGAGYVVGSLWIDTTNDQVYWCADAGSGAAIWRQVGGSGSGTSLKETVTASNSFAAANVIRRTSGSYLKAQADSASNAEVFGVVESATGSSFVVVYHGKCNISGHGFTVGAVLFLSSGTSGLLTATEPSTEGQVSKPVAIALDANNLLILNMRGMTVGASNAFDDIAPTTTKGDLIVSTGSTNVRQAVGADGTLISADSTKTNGVGYITPPFTRHQYFSTSGTFNVPADCSKILIEGWGPGGGGYDPATSQSGAGGGGGGYGRKINAVTPGGTVTVTIGAGGNRGLPGTDGGDTVCGGMTCHGGKGATSRTNPGAGGTVTGADFSIQGQTGESNVVADAAARGGGDSPRGGAGGRYPDQDGLAPGGGGAAGVQGTSTNAGNGAAGGVLITY